MYINLFYTNDVSEPQIIELLYLSLFSCYRCVNVYLTLIFADFVSLVGCWSSVSIRRIIYKFLNVCPFDYTTVAVSGKVERSKPV